MLPKRLPHSNHLENRGPRIRNIAGKWVRCFREAKPKELHLRECIPCVRQVFDDHEDCQSRSVSGRRDRNALTYAQNFTAEDEGANKNKTYGKQKDDGRYHSDGFEHL